MPATGRLTPGQGSCRWLPDKTCPRVRRPRTAAPAADTAYSQSQGQCSNNLWTEIGDYCEDCCEAGCIAGVEGTFLAPINEPGQSVGLTDLKHHESFSGTVFAGFGGGVRAWLGLHRCGWGYRVTYWHFGDREISDQPTIPKDGKSAFAKSFLLDADTLDIEITQSGFCVGNWELETSFGGRYARLHRKATALGFATLGGVDLTSLAMGTNELEGAGFTFSIGGKRQLGCDSGWHCFWNYRGSLLWADTKALALTEASAVSYRSGRHGVLPRLGGRLQRNRRTLHQRAPPRPAIRALLALRARDGVRPLRDGIPVLEHGFRAGVLRFVSPSCGVVRRKLAGVPTRAQTRTMAV